MKNDLVGHMVLVLQKLKREQAAKAEEIADKDFKPNGTNVDANAAGRRSKRVLKEVGCGWLSNHARSTQGCQQHRLFPTSIFSELVGIKLGGDTINF